MVPSERPRSSFYDRLVDRYIELPRWPTSKKTTLTLAIVLSVHVILTMMAVFAMSRASDIIDARQLSRLLFAWCVALGVMLLVSAFVSTRGWEGRWTIYLVIGVYGAFLVRLLSIFGAMSTPLVAWAPVVIIYVGLFFDARAGMVAAFYFILLYVLVAGLELSGVLSYASAILDRRIDAQRNPYYYVTVFTVVWVVMAYVFVMTALAASAREHQQEKLEHANVSLTEARDQVSRANEIISRYVASQLARQILAGNYDALEKHERRKLTLFFSDIKDFAEIADHVEPEDLSEVLNEYLSEMASIGERYGGTIDKFVGDAVMIFFGAPVPSNDRDNALRAVKMAIEMQARMLALREKWVRDGFEHPFVIRIGINTGQATIGNFGSKGRVDYTAIGRQVNLAARLQVHCDPGKILLGHSTWVLVREHVTCIEKGEIIVKGFQNPVQVHEVVGLKADTADLDAERARTKSG